MYVYSSLGVQVDESMPPTARQLEGPLFTSTQLNNKNEEPANFTQLVSQTTLISDSTLVNNRSQLNTSKNVKKSKPRKFVIGF